jgi:broad specificity phosphatase PhoE
VRPRHHGKERNTVRIAERVRIVCLVLRFHFPAFGNPRSGQELLRRYMDTTQPQTEANGARPATDPAQAAQHNGGHAPKPARLVLLVRHGETTYNIEGRLPGQLPGVLLTDEGRRQAHRAAVALAALPLSSVISSPLERARDTAEIIARGWNLPLRLDERLLDTDVAPWAGRKIEEIAREDPGWKAYLEHPNDPPAGVESFASVQARAVAAVEDALRDPATGQYVVAVAHADVIKLIVAHYTGVPITTARFLSIANASISALAFTEGLPPALLATNWTAVPSWLVPAAPKPERPPQSEEDAAVQTDVAAGGEPVAPPERI